MAAAVGGPYVHLGCVLACRWHFLSLCKHPCGHSLRSDPTCISLCRRSGRRTDMAHVSTIQDLATEPSTGKTPPATVLRLVSIHTPTVGHDRAPTEEEGIPLQPCNRPNGGIKHVSRCNPRVTPNLQTSSSVGETVVSAQKQRDCRVGLRPGLRARTG